MVGQHLNHGRDDQRGRDFLLLDRGHHQFRIEGPDDHIGAAADQRGEHGAAIGQVKHRRGVEVDRALGQQAFAQHMQRVADDVGVTEHHALGAAGGASGVEDTGEILTRRHRVGDGLARRNQFLVVLRFGRPDIVVGINQFHRNRVSQFDAHGSEGLVHHQNRGAAVVQRILDLGMAPSDVGRHDDRAGPGNPQIKFEISIGVQHQHRDTVATFDAEVLQRARQPCDPVADLAPAAAAVAVDGRDPLRVGLQHPAQALGDVHEALPDIPALDAPSWLAAIIPTGAGVARRGRPALPALCGPRRQGRRGQGHVPLGADSSV